MRIGFYLKLAWEGIRKNMRLYLPYFLTGAVMVMMYYIMLFLSETDMLQDMQGGATLRTVLPLGSWVIVIFSVIFLFYSNSLLIRQRNREFGLYNILGMDKKNLGYLMFWENLFAAVISIVCGLVLGVGLSKLAELGMVNLLKEEITYKFLIDWSCVGRAALYYGLIYVVLLVNAWIRIGRNNPLALLHSSNVGEKPPKGNWFFALVGLILLAVAYYISVTKENPLSAILWFFGAVIMVIVATYLLFISGSVVFCRLLQKNKKYYYKKNHFISVSSMVYRMKRNGAGLASISILITMVLVMLSAVLSLYIGAEDSLKGRYPYDISMSVPVQNIEEWNEDSFSKMRQTVKEIVPEIENEREYASGQVACFFTENGAEIASESEQSAISDKLGFLEIMSLEQYNRLVGEDETLEDGECMLYCFRTEFDSDTFSIQNDTPMKVKKHLDKMTVPGYAAMQILPSVFLVVEDVETTIEPIMFAKNLLNDNLALQFVWNYNFDLDLDAESQIDAYYELLDNMDRIIIRTEDGGYSYSLDGKEAGRAEFYGMYGGLFFIGILLGLVFLFAAVLIIYYKQISEGYEDAARFTMMRKVGMTKKDIRKSINSQVLTVFFAPLILAGIHQAFAFPLVWRLLQMFNLQDMKLMIMVTVGSFVLLSVFYSIIYKLTANVYYRIVSGAK